MYRVTWDKETGGILLTDNSAGGMDGEIRPIFHQELDLLGLRDRWTYTRSDAPLLWALGRRYFYRGELVAEVKGGGFFGTAQVICHKDGISLETVDVEGMVAKNRALMEGLEFRAIEFIHKQHEERQQVHIVAVAFSGGKDSLATLDLVTRALPPDGFVVIFDDTTMELSATYEAKDRAAARWPNLRFHTARADMPATETWKLFGPPSRMHRWCCSVHKSAPTMLLVRELAGKRTVRVLLFDGVRKAESQRRASYNATSPGAKLMTQVNASPILNWSSCEVILYLCERHLMGTLNESYRFGLPRVGCMICPYGSSWSEYVAWMRYGDDIAPLMQRLVDYARRECRALGPAEDYIRHGRWKMRSGGRAVVAGGNRALAAERETDMQFLLRRPRESWLEWVKAVGPMSREGASKGRIERDGILYSFDIQTHGEDLDVSVQGAQRADRFLKRDLRSVAYKAAYCSHCRVCEAECPTGALTVDASVRIDERKCTHCGRCLSYIDKGCWAAKSLTVSTRGDGVKGINAYQTFGMSREWLADFFRDPENWWHAHTLGPRQFDAMQVWLYQAGIVDRQHNALTPLGRGLRGLGASHPLTWPVIWENLARNSVLVKWYVRNVPFGRSYTKQELVDIMGGRLAERTRANAVTSLVRLLSETPLGTDLGLGRVEKTGSRTRAVVKDGARSLPPLAYLYSLYRCAETLDKYALSVAEIARQPGGGPMQLFGVEREEFTRNLRGLSSQHPEWVSVELVRDLDNIYLEHGYSSERVLDLA